jgi:hypothetical protein
MVPFIITTLFGAVLAAVTTCLLGYESVVSHRRAGQTPRDSDWRIVGILAAVLFFLGALVMAATLSVLIAALLGYRSSTVTWTVGISAGVIALFLLLCDLLEPPDADPKRPLPPVLIDHDIPFMALFCGSIGAIGGLATIPFIVLVCLISMGVLLIRDDQLREAITRG